MSGAIERKQKISNIFNVVGSIIFVLSLLTAFGLFPYAEGHLLIKRETEDKIAPKECERKIKETEAKDVECFEIDSNVKCEEHCNVLGEHKCGGTKGKAYNFQCKNPQRGDKKACCCAFKCESKAETKRRLEELYAKMKEDNRGMCSPFTDSEDGFKGELMKICSEDDRIHIARKYCLEEFGGDRYFCLKIGECKGKRTKTCMGCIAHECVKPGEDEGEHIVIPEEYEKNRTKLQDFEKNAIGNVQQISNTIKKEKHCINIKCKDDDCDKKCRISCKHHGNKECGGRALSYGTTVEGKRSGGKEGDNKCCCEPICSPKDVEESDSGDNGHDDTSGENTRPIEEGSDKPEEEKYSSSKEKVHSPEQSQSINPAVEQDEGKEEEQNEENNEEDHERYKEKSSTEGGIIEKESKSIFRSGIPKDDFKSSENNDNKSKENKSSPNISENQEEKSNNISNNKEEEGSDEQGQPKEHQEKSDVNQKDISLEEEDRAELKSSREDIKEGIKSDNDEKDNIISKESKSENISNKEDEEMSTENIETNKHKKQPEDQEEDDANEKARTLKANNKDRLKSSEEDVKDDAKSINDENDKTSEVKKGEKNKDYMNTEDFYETYGVDDDDDEKYETSLESESEEREEDY